MPLRITLFVVCLLVSVLCLVCGQVIPGQWIGAAIAVVLVPGWILARKHSGSWPPFVCLLSTTCLAIAGLLSGAPAVLMVTGLGFGLAAWDLLLLDDTLGATPARVQIGRYESAHIKSLTVSLGCGLVLSILGHLFTLRVPFIVLLGFAVAALLGLDRIWVYIKKPR